MLSTDKIKELLSHGENKQVEFKKCTDKVSASVYETVCSFLNAEGGYIFLGVDDDGTILGINPKCVTDMTKSIINTLNNPEQFLPPMPITPEQAEIDGKIILYLNVPESEQVHRYNIDTKIVSSTVGVMRTMMCQNIPIWLRICSCEKKRNLPKTKCFPT